MQDRVALFPGRVKLTPVNGQQNTYDMVRQDNPTVEGTPLNKESLLADDVAEALGLEPAAATPSQAIAELNDKVKTAVPKKHTVSLPTASWMGAESPYSQTISGLGATANSKVDIQMDATSLGVLIDSGTSAIWMENNNGTITAKVLGEKPSADMTVQVTITEVTA